MGHVGVWAGEPGNWGGGVCSGKLAHPSHKCHPLRETQEYFIVSLKTEPPVQLFGNSRGQDRCGKWGEGLLVKHLRSCYWGWGEIGCGSRAQIFLAPHTRALAPLKAIKTQGHVFIPPSAKQMASESALAESVFK